MLVWLILCIMFVGVSAPLPPYTAAMSGTSITDRNELISHYFHQGLSNSEIIAMLLSVHCISLSLSHLKRLLRLMGLKRRQPCTQDNLRELLDAVREELKGSGSCLGYKSMWRRLKRRGINVPRIAVRHALRILDPEGVDSRRRRKFRRRKYINPGPNHTWHVDGYDKLKPFGFAIHGCIDGYSRKIIWLEVGPSNNNPYVVTSYYLEALLQTNVIPRVMRCDLGSENCHLANLQPYFAHTLGVECDRESFLYGKSTANQRIEAWWGILRRQGADFWISLFKDLRDTGCLNTHNTLHIKSLWFAFLNLIRQDLYNIAVEWNQHPIESRANADGPRGKPDILYYIHQNYGTVINRSEVERFIFNIEQNDHIPADHDPEFVRYVNTALPHWQEPSNTLEALQLFSDILDTFNENE